MYQAHQGPLAASDPRLAFGHGHGVGDRTLNGVQQILDRAVTGGPDDGRFFGCVGLPRRYPTVRCPAVLLGIVDQGPVGRHHVAIDRVCAHRAASRQPFGFPCIGRREHSGADDIGDDQLAVACSNPVNALLFVPGDLAIGFVVRGNSGERYPFAGRGREITISLLEVCFDMPVSARLSCRVG